MITPRNSVMFPVDGGESPERAGVSSGKRSLSELLRLHAQKGTACSFSAEEASRVADVLGQWVRDLDPTTLLNILAKLSLKYSQINSGSSPYESEDDFFSRSQDDSSIPSKRLPGLDPNARPRGQSESILGSRPPSSAGIIKT